MIIAINPDTGLQAVPGGTSRPVTMTSLELVDYINSQREPGDSAVLRHRDFMAKVPNVLGEGGSDKYRGVQVHPQNGQTFSVYRFPKREACLMAMSYSYDLLGWILLKRSMQTWVHALVQCTPLNAKTTQKGTHQTTAYGQLLKSKPITEQQTMSSNTPDSA